MKNKILKIKDNYQLVIGVFIVGLLFGWIFFHWDQHHLHSHSSIAMGLNPWHK